MLTMPSSHTPQVEPRMQIQHVAFFVPSLEGGGAEHVTVTLANETAALVKRVDLVVGTALGPWRTRVSEHVRLIELGSVRVFRCLAPLIRYLRSERPDCLLSNLTHANLGAALARALSGQGMPLFVREASTLSRSLAELGWCQARVMAAMAHVACRLADGIVAPMDDVATDLSRVLGRGLSHKIHVVPNPLDLLEIERASNEPVPRALSGVPRPWIVGCGRLIPAKGFDTLIRAFPQVTARNTAPPSLIILGEGPERRALEDLARALGVASRTVLPGFVDNPFSVFRRAAVFALPSRREGCPNALLQAMACGTTVVAADCPSGPREIVRDEREGSIVPVNDSSALAAALTHKLASPNDPRVARERVQAFSAQRIARQLLSLLEAALLDKTTLARRTPARRLSACVE
jgi:glycosyltransferase involved in cell wall biosynthesis